MSQPNREDHPRSLNLKDAQGVIARNLVRQVWLNRLLQDELSRSENLDEKLKAITDTIVEAFDADFCRIWMTAPGDRCDSGCVHAGVTEGPHVCRHRDRCLHLLASSGRYTHLDGEAHRRVPFGCYKIGRVAAAQDSKFITNDVRNDPRVHNHDWARECGLVSFAGYRLCATDGTPIGVLALFAKHSLSPDEDILLEGVATSASHVIQTARAEQKLKRTYAELEERVLHRTVELASTNNALQLEIARRERVEEALRASEARTQEVLAAATQVSIIATDAQGVIAVFNPGAEQMLGYSAAEMIGRQTPKVLHLESEVVAHGQDLTRELGCPVEGFDVFVAKAKRGGHERHEWTYVRKDGSHVAVDLVVTAIHDSAGAISGFLGIAEDISERKRAETELREYAERVEVSNGALQQAHAEAEMARKRAEDAKAKLEATQRELIEASRRAGMADVASGVLHSVGNVLNSANVSTQLVADRVRQFRIAGLQKATALLEEHSAELGTFLTTDERGRQLPGYLAQVARFLSDNQVTVLDELNSLTKNIDHIKTIVGMQQAYAKAGGVIEQFPLNDLIDDSLRMSSTAFERHGIKVVKEYESEDIELTGDRQRIMQILVNLIRNAKHALRDSEIPNTCKRIAIRVSTQCDRIEITVADNGPGITPEQLGQVFTMGFTTKQNGHGFGLHSSALAAKEMGGSLAVRSEGHGRGATFVLEVPVSCSTTC